ncbi:hypothetical protein Hamer_G011312 [Homarus americanus]|uniref:Transmembrane protein n=1 Tax=Homarus americanus TaxID=6706 RepID=A0A8J5JIH2_HOMAM|nr:hypothetical protein Hamer_G011312 [Homarus americanus]
MMQAQQLPMASSSSAGCLKNTTIAFGAIGFAKSSPTASGVVDLQQNTARLVAFTIAGFSVWVTSTVWFIQGTDYYHSETVMVFFFCNFGFVFAALVAGLAGGLNETYSKQLSMVMVGPQIISPVVQQMTPSGTPYHYQGPAPPRAPSSHGHSFYR